MPNQSQRNWNIFQILFVDYLHKIKANTNQVCEKRDTISAVRNIIQKGKEEIYQYDIGL